MIKYSNISQRREIVCKHPLERRETLLNKMFDTVDLLKRGLDAAWTQNRILSNNIANGDTPGFKATHMAFGDLLNRVSEETGFKLKTTREDHKSSFFDTDPERSGIQSAGISYRMDENSVDVEAEMAALAQNSLHYNTMIQKLNSEFSKLNMAIRGQ